MKKSASYYYSTIQQGGRGDESSDESNLRNFFNDGPVFGTVERVDPHFVRRRKSSFRKSSFLSNASEMMEMIPEDEEPMIESPAPLRLPKFMNQGLIERRKRRGLIVIEECDDKKGLLDSHREKTG